MASLLTLDLVRMELRKQVQELARRYPGVGISAPVDGPEMELIQHANALEEICELIGKQKLLNVICHLAQHRPGGHPYLREICIAGAVIGSPHPLILDFEAAAARDVEPEGYDDDPPVPEPGG